MYVGPEAIIGPSDIELHGIDCRTVASTKMRDAHGTWIRQYIVADTEDDLIRLRTASRVAEAIRKDEAPHLVQVSVVDDANAASRSDMRGRAIGAQVTIIPEPVADFEIQAGRYSGFSMQGAAGADGNFYGVRFDVPQQDIGSMIDGFREVRGCPAGAPSGA
ncbi:hypothetical protein [Rhizobium sp.]|uniref:hypothetical protein n=1 Tax=Rhizobium sp. TaxID=391 RepID=UPI0028A20E59